MRMQALPLRALLAGCLAVAAAAETEAAEYGFSTYALGGSAFGAGVMPPAGTYVTTLSAYYSADLNANVSFGGVQVNAGADFELYTIATNILYVPERKVLGGSFGVGVTIPVGHVNTEAGVAIGPLSASREVDGWGLGDITTRAQLGWQHGEFAHLFYVQAVAPTGRWDPGFSPILGLHRPGFDTGWAFTWANQETKFQFNGTLGFTFNFENTETNYESGDEFHFEWAIGREFATGLVVGIVGYDYRQLTGDSGSGARLGSRKGSVDAIGPGLSYTTLIGMTPFVFNLRHYQEFNAERRWEGNSTFASGTIRF